MAKYIDWSRREFLEFLGRSSAVATTSSFPFWTSCAKHSVKPATLPLSPIPHAWLKPSKIDEVLLMPGLEYRVLAKWGDVFTPDGQKFGFNCDHIQWVPLGNSTEDFILMVNHEYVNDLFISGYAPPAKKTKSMVDQEQKMVGVSLLQIKKHDNETWQIMPGSKYNRRIHAQTPIPIVTARPIENATTAIGTLSNCAGGKTPWNTFLTCEENYPDVYGEAIFTNGKREVVRRTHYYAVDWEKFYPYPPEHYGWVVEINPLTAQAKKLTSLGRFEHEGATVRQAADGRCVVYMGDDNNDQCLYKFVASAPGSLENGTLYAANTSTGKWLALDYKKDKTLQKHFKDQTEVLIRTREAAKLLGASELDRPEGIAVDPLTGAVIVALTNNKPKKNFFGSLLKISEKNNDPLATEFQATTLATGGDQGGFICPDNLIFDRKGNLWFTTDVFGGDLVKPEYERFGNNGLFVIPTSGANAGKAFQVASAPIDAEFTGPMFSQDGKTLFLAVQHPGETTINVTNPTSTWPGGKGTTPKSAVITIHGPFLE